MYKSTSIPNTRIEVADALRGIAIAGIILYHSIEHFNIVTFGTPVAHTLPIDDGVMKVAAWLISGKMYGIFAMLFGLSFFIMNDNQQQKGKNFSGRFAWRMCLLLIFGVLNTALYDGDILFAYALYGILLIPISRMSNKWAWVLTIFLLIQPTNIFSHLTGLEIPSGNMMKSYAAMTPAHTDGTFWENTLDNLRWGQIANFQWNISTGRLTQLLGLFILGMLLGRHRFFYNEGNNLKKWGYVFVISVFFTIALSFVVKSSWSAVLKPIQNTFIMMMIVSAVVWLWYKVPAFCKAIKPMCLFGRMSLTNYFLQSFIGTLLFCGWGFGLYDKLGNTWSILVGLAMFIFQYYLCKLWSKKHSKGPLEDAWKKLTWIGSEKKQF